MTRRNAWVGSVFLPALFLYACSSAPEAKLAKHVKKGDEYVKEQKYREAVIEYKNAVKAVPKDASAHWKLAQAALEAKDLRTAFQEHQETVNLDPSNFDALGKLGEIYVVAGKIHEATQFADNLVRSRPGDPQGYILQSGISVRAGKVDDAIANLRKANELDPKRIRTMLTIGNLYLLKRDRKNAQESLVGRFPPVRLAAGSAQLTRIVAARRFSGGELCSLAERVLDLPVSCRV